MPIKLKIRSRSKKIKIKIKRSTTQPTYSRYEWNKKLNALFKNSDNQSYIEQEYQATFKEVPAQHVRSIQMYNKLAYHFFKQSLTPEEWEQRTSATKMRYMQAQNLQLYRGIPR